MLRSSAAIDVSAEPSPSVDGVFDISVRVTNLTGHKLPTGYAEGRLMWLNLRVVDNAGAVVFESGRYDSQEAVVEHDSRLRTYEVVHGEWDGESCTAIEDGKRAFHFVLSECVVSDTRIPPLGFRGAENPEIAPVGRDYSLDDQEPSSRLANYDVATYSIKPLSGTPFPLTVTATLRYQTATREYIEFLRDQAVEHGFPTENELCASADQALGRTRQTGPQDRTRGAYMYELWEREGKSPPVDMASAEVQLDR